MSSLEQCLDRNNRCILPSSPLRAFAPEAFYGLVAVAGLIVRCADGEVARREKLYGASAETRVPERLFGDR
jgi:hypothetical protein